MLCVLHATKIKVCNLKLNTVVVVKILNFSILFKLQIDANLNLNGCRGSTSISRSRIMRVIIQRANSSSTEDPSTNSIGAVEQSLIISVSSSSSCWRGSSVSIFNILLTTVNWRQVGAMLKLNFSELTRVDVLPTAPPTRTCLSQNVERDRLNTMQEK